MADCSPKNIIHRRSTIVLVSSRMHHSEFVVHSPSSWATHSPCSLKFLNIPTRRFIFVTESMIIWLFHVFWSFFFYNGLSNFLRNFKITKELFLFHYVRYWSVENKRNSQLHRRKGILNAWRNLFSSISFFILNWWNWSYRELVFKNNIHKVIGFLFFFDKIFLSRIE